MTKFYVSETVFTARGPEGLVHYARAVHNLGRTAEIRNCDWVLTGEDAPGPVTCLKCLERGPL